VPHRDGRIGGNTLGKQHTTAGQERFTRATQEAAILQPRLVYSGAGSRLDDDGQHHSNATSAINPPRSAKAAISA
jgi:hypothetical protein